MQFKCVTYTSLAALDLQDQEARAIQESAYALNGIDGISGILIFNGTHFLQLVEGPPDAIDELIDRIRRDPRHSGIEIRDERMLEERLFGDWSMKLVRVRSSFMLAQHDVIPQLPAGLPDPIRDRILAMVERISEDVEL